MFCCRMCNSSKSNLTLPEFLGRLRQLKEYFGVKDFEFYYLSVDPTLIRGGP
jgi:hypothetical protein